MAGRPARYRDRDHAYRADTCAPLVTAATAGQVRLEAVARAGYPGRRLGRSDLPGLSTAGYWDAVGSQSWGLDWHRNEGIELTFLETGGLPWSVGGRDYDLAPNDMTITRPWQPHRVGDPRVRPSRLHWIIVDVGVRRPNQDWQWPVWLVLTPADRAALTTLLRHNEQPVWRTTPEIRHAFREIGRTLAHPEGRCRISRLAVYLNELFLVVLDMLRSHDLELDPSLSSTSRMVRLFLTELREDPVSLARPWDSRSLARQCGLGVTQFVHYCRQLTNLPPMQYLNRCRVEHAEDLLGREPARSITDIALACGFRSSQYFATVFRRYRGCSPRARRRGDASGTGAGGSGSLPG